MRDNTERQRDMLLKELISDGLIECEVLVSGTDWVNIGFQNMS